MARSTSSTYRSGRSSHPPPLVLVRQHKCALAPVRDSAAYTSLYLTSKFEWVKLTRRPTASRTRTFLPLEIDAKSPLRERHAWNTIPKGWMLQRRAPANLTFDMSIGLKQAKLDDLLESLHSVSNLGHERYGAHLTRAEVDELTAPHDDARTVVVDWLGSHFAPIIHNSTSGDVVMARVSVAQAERMLDTTYSVYQHSQTGETIVRCLKYSLPKALDDHVDLLWPTTYFGTRKSMIVSQSSRKSPREVKESQLTGRDAVPESCASIITPACLRGLYNSASYVPTQTSKNSLGITGYLENYASFSDLQLFIQRFRPDAAGGNFSVELINGGSNDQSLPGKEANLDVQYALGMAYPTPLTFYSTGGSPPFLNDSNTPTNTNEPYLDWLQYLLAKDDIPQTLSTSYGDDEQSVPPAYARRVCNLFAQLGARGNTVLFSSGDGGVGGGDCLTNDGSNKVLFQPIFPASCPYVTAVGATTGINPEVADSELITSGGGFSRYFARPGYQDQAVSSYLTRLGCTNEGLYDMSGRAYPDVSAQGENFQMIRSTFTVSASGTSASCPTFAGIVTLLNDYRLSKGMASLGFLNPMLYSKGFAGLNDVLIGSNPGCGTSGFPVMSGWDPVTGLGTPDFEKLKKIVA